jgi:hypothetical protein
VDLMNEGAWLADEKLGRSAISKAAWQLRRPAEKLLLFRNRSRSGRIADHKDSHGGMCPPR